MAPHLTDDNVDEVLAKAAHRSKAEIEVIVAGLAPRPDLPTAINPIVSEAGLAGDLQLVPEPPPAQPTRLASGPPPVRPLSPEKYGLQVTITQATRDKLERATALLRHRNPSGDVAEVLDRALDALLVTLEREKFGATSRPRAKGARPESPNPRYVSNEVKRGVHARDGEQCTFVSADGVRCTERGFLELDHRMPVALGGKATVVETRMLCRAHNQYEAERLLGVDFMRAKREGARAARKTRTRPSAAAARTKGSEPAIVDATEVERNASPSASLDADVTSALRGLGWKADETRKAMADTADESAPDFESRIRAALAALSRSRASRCSDGPEGPAYASGLISLAC